MTDACEACGRLLTADAADRGASVLDGMTLCGDCADKAGHGPGGAS